MKRLLHDAFNKLAGLMALCTACVLLSAGNPVYAQSVELVTADLSRSVSPEDSRLHFAPEEVEDKNRQALNKLISVDLEGTPLEEALQAISSQSDIRIAYSKDVTEARWQQPVTLQLEQATVLGALYAALEDTGLKLKLSSTSGDGQLVVVNDLSVELEEGAEVEALQTSVSGRVPDSETGESLPGVNVVVQGSDQVTGSVVGSQTGIDGEYSLQVPEGLNTLLFTYIGYEPVEVTIDGQSQVDIEMITSVQLLEDVVVVGYGARERINLTGAVDQVTSRDLENRPMQNLTQGLQGAMPNVNINMVEGKPIHSPEINIRGTTSINGGSALVLIDGVEGDPSMLNPNDIESISVLKDASASAIYGARGAFGVVLITTRSPEAGQLSVTYSGNVGLNQPTVPQNRYVTDGLQWTNMFVESFVNWEGTFPAGVNKSVPFSQNYLQELEQRFDDPSMDRTWIGNDGNYRYAHSTDWYGHLYRESTWMHDHNLSISGSTPDVNYMISGRIQDQEGLIRLSPDDYNSQHIRAKGTIDLADWLQVNNNFQFSNRSYFNPQNCCDAQYAQLDIALEGFPIAPLYNPDGTLSESGAYALGGYAEGYNGRNLDRSVLRNTVGAEGRFFEDRLSIVGDFSFQRTDITTQQKRVPVSFSRAPGVTETIGAATNWLREDRGRTDFLATNLYLQYQEVFGDRHDVGATIGYNYEQSTVTNLAARRGELIFPGATNINLALGDDIDTSGSFGRWKILGGFYRLNYIFDERYLVELTGRYDGSSKFPENERFAFFPSASVGWRISSEPFWNVPDDIINHLQLRASYGSMGNGDINAYLFHEQFGISRSARMLDGTRPRFTRNPAVLPEGLTWETATTRNLGLNLEMFNGRLEFSGDVYVRETTDMFAIALTPPATFGATAPRGNYADLETRGWELMLGWRDMVQVGGSPMSYNIQLSLADHQAEITRYNNPDMFLNDYYEGMTIGEIWGYETEGFFESYEDVANHADQSRFRSTSAGDFHPGDIKLRDLDGNGVINPGANTLDNPGDRRVIGNTTPRYTFGVNLGAEWRNFFISGFFQGVGKRDWYPAAESSFWGQYNRPYNHVPAWHTNDGMIWSEENPDSFFPRYVSRLASSGIGMLHHNQAQTGYLMNAAYVRLKNLQVGYNLPVDLVSRAGMRMARIYISGENLWSWSPLYKPADPLDIENMIARPDSLARPSDTSTRQGYNYPILRTITLGVSITF